MTAPDLDAVARRYSAALNAKPSKGEWTQRGIDALTDSVSDVGELLAALQWPREERRVAHAQIAGVLREYGQAIRGDWGCIDGRTVRAELDDLARWIGDPATFPGRDAARECLGICAGAYGHWATCCDEQCGTDPDYRMDGVR